MSLRVGAIGVQKVSARLLEQGFLVSMPIVDEGYDLISDWRGKLLRVQVKTTSGASDTRTRNKLKFLACKGPGFSQGSLNQRHREKTIYNKSDCDIFVFYHLPQSAIFIIPRSKLPKTKSVYFAPNCVWRDNWDILRNIKKS